MTRRQTTRRQTTGLIIGGSMLLEYPVSGTATTPELLMTCLAKLSTRIPSEKVHIQQMLEQYETSECTNYIIV